LIELPSAREIEGTSDVASVVIVRIVANLLVLLLVRPTSSKLEYDVVTVVSVIALDAIDCRVLSATDPLKEASPTEARVESTTDDREGDTTFIAQLNKPGPWPSTGFGRRGDLGGGLIILGTSLSSGALI